jgi:hypothetical protein
VLQAPVRVIFLVEIGYDHGNQHLGKMESALAVPHEPSEDAMIIYYDPLQPHNKELIEQRSVLTGKRATSRVSARSPASNPVGFPI